MDCQEERRRTDAADVIDALCQQWLPGLVPCEQTPQVLCAWLEREYDAQLLPEGYPGYAHTALSVVETYFPEDAEYLPFDPEERGPAALELVPVLGLALRCYAIPQSGPGAALYDEQKRRFEQRGAAFGLVWTPQPITVCLETSTGYRTVFGSERLADELTVQRGVSQQDVEEQTPELMRYLRALHFLEQEIPD